MSGTLPIEAKMNRNWEGRRVLITGGAGFIGSWVTRLVSDSAAERIAVLDNLVNGQREFVPESARIDFHIVDLSEGEAVAEVVLRFRPEVVLHLAALHFIPYCNAHPAETMRTNVLGTQHILEACRAASPQSLVIASSAAVYGICDTASTEDDPAEPTDIYGLTKWINEKQLELFARETQTRCAALRFFNVYGPHETNPHVIPEIVRQISEGSNVLCLGNCKPRRDYVYVTDVARAVVAVAERNEHRFRVFNVGTGQEFSVEQIVSILREVTGRPVEIQVDPERVRPSDRMHLLCDRRRIGNEIGWEPEHDLAQGLRQLWGWQAQPRV